MDSLWVFTHELGGIINGIKHIRQTPDRLTKENISRFQKGGFKKARRNCIYSG